MQRDGGRSGVSCSPLRNIGTSSHLGLEGHLGFTFFIRGHDIFTQANHRAAQPIGIRFSSSPLKMTAGAGQLRAQLQVEGGAASEGAAQKKKKKSQFFRL